MILFAFDVDGTLESSDGPVPLRVLDWFFNHAVAVGVVSPSDKWPKKEYGYLDFSTFGSRVGNLKALAENYPEAVIRIYVSDNKDVTEAQTAGFCYIEAGEFAKGLPLQLPRDPSLYLTE